MKMFFLLCACLGILSTSASAASFTSAQIRDWGDFLFASIEKPAELDDPALSAVTSEFGASVIPINNLPLDSPEGTAAQTPWSSWWFPKIDRDLFDDGRGTSPLEKYDIVRAAFSGKPSDAAKLERGSHSSTGPRWEGLCDAWAMAAMLYPEPVEKRTITTPKGMVVSFSVGDQKALLLKTMDSIPASALKNYGQRFTGNVDGWIFPDLFPQELHRFVEVQLFERREAFVMDHDAGPEVWSEPVYKANFRIQAVPGQTNAVFVRLWLYSATSYPNKDQKDNVGVRELVREYNYFLYGKQDGRGNLVVTSGVWAKGDLVDSRRDHPDFVYTMNRQAEFKRVSRNPEIDAAMVDKILGL